MADQTNMYRFSVKQWSPWAGCEHDCTYCKPTFQRQLKRWGKKNCEACYHFTPHEHEERLEDPRLPKTGFMQFIFTCSSGDIAFCPVGYLEKILATIRRHPDRTFLLQTKDPRILHKVKLPGNVIAGVTLETNRDALCQAVSKAPPASERYEVFKSLEHGQKMVTIEPVMDFDLETMVAWIEDIRPCMVWLGYDSWKSGLPEPELAKVKTLYWKLGKRGIAVLLKTIREARHEAQTSPEDESRELEKQSSSPAAPRVGDWNEASIKGWANSAEPSSRLAMWILAHGVAKTVRELNAAAVLAGLKDSKGAVVGGIKAVATRTKRLSPFDESRAGGTKMFTMRTELQPLFQEVLKEWPEARMVPDPLAS